MTPYYDRDGITIYCGDCLEVMPKLDIEFDLIISDVPYLCISGGSTNEAGLRWGKGRPTGILANNNGKRFKHNNVTAFDYASMFYAWLRTPAHCYIMINPLNLEDTLTEFRLAGFGFHNLLTWAKGNKIANRWYMQESEPILFFRKGPAFTINNPSQGEIIYADNIKDKDHPTEKPTNLMRQLIIQSSQIGEVICDPFMGTGAALRAAKQESRKAVGIEIDEDYCRIAVDRLRQPSFFSLPQMNGSGSKAEQLELMT